MVKNKAKEKGLEVAFWLKDIMEADIPGAPFHMAFDRGCFHRFDAPDKKVKFAKKIYDHLESDGIWISLIGNVDEIS